MNQKTLSIWLKVILTVTGICGLAVYLWILPGMAESLIARAPEFASCYVPWLVFLIAAGIPCYAALAIVWKIAINIGGNRSFCLQNANLLKYISILASADAALFFGGNIVFLLLDMSHPSIVLVSLSVVLIGIAISVVAALLSHLIHKASVLQEQSDLTI